MKSSQIEQAAHFRNQEHLSVVAVQETVLAAAKRFMDGHSRAVLPENAINTIEIEIHRKNVSGFVRNIRPLASHFMCAGISSTFWDMVDAANFFSDATDSNWPYITVERRKQSLVWAAEHAALVH